MLMSLEAPEDVAKNAPQSGAEVPTKTGRHVIRIRDLLSWVSDGTIAPYPKNRGGRTRTGEIRPSVAERTVKSVRYDFHGWSYAGATACQVDDRLTRKYGLDGSPLILADGHSGIQGLFHRFWDGNLSRQDLDFKIVLTVAPPEEFLKIYTMRNIQSGQTASQTLACDDLFYGHIIWNKIFALLSEDAQNILLSRKKLLPQLSYIIEVWNRRNRANFNYLEVFHARMATKAKSIQAADKTNAGLTEEDLEELANAVNWYAEYMVRLEDKVVEAGMGAKQLSAIKGSAPWLGIILTELLRTKGSKVVLPRDGKIGTLVNQTKRNITEVAEVLPLITHSRNMNIETQISKLSKALKSKS